MAGINDLPFEILSNILTYAAKSNAEEIASFTYGLSKLPRSMRQDDVQKHVRGRLPNDQLRWNSANPLRKVCSAWHEWALSYAMKELYVRRWRGGESWETSWLNKDHPRGGPKSTDTLPVVYKDPYRTARSTAKLLRDFPSIASHVRRLWFNGIYAFETMPFIHDIVSNCPSVVAISVPWTAVRFWTSAEWLHILSFPNLQRLEFMMIDMKLFQLTGLNMVDTCPFRDHRVSLANIKRLKISGNSNANPICDKDLIEMSRTAKNLRSLIVTNTTEVSINGISALVAASNDSLRTLDFSPLMTPPLPARPILPGSKPHTCTHLVTGNHLSDVNITLPTICPSFFQSLPRTLDSPLRIRFSGGCNGYVNRKTLAAVFTAARAYLSVNRNLYMELLMGPYSFDPRNGLVHGYWADAAKASNGQWVADGFESTRGPYGSSGIWGEDKEWAKEWQAIPEYDFLDGVENGWIRL